MGASSAVQAQVVFKHTMPNGQVIYSDRPMAGAVKSEEVHVLRSASPSNSTAAAAPSGSDQATAQEDSNQRRLENQRTTTADAEARLEAARQSLAAAEQALEQGREVQPGDRVGGVQSRSRLRESYLARVKQLEENVAAAKRALQEAEERRSRIN